MLSNKELNNISGGGKGLVISLVIGAIVTFIVGVIDGYQRPLKCNY